MGILNRVSCEFVSKIKKINQDLQRSNQEPKPLFTREKKKKTLVVENGKQLTQSTKEVMKNLVIIMGRVLCGCVLKFLLEQTVVVKFGTSLETLFY